MTYQAKRATRWGYSAVILAAITGTIMTSSRVTAEVQNPPLQSSTGFSGVEPYRGTHGSSGITLGGSMYIVRTIHYVYEDGTTAAPDVLDALMFDTTGTVEEWEWAPSARTSNDPYVTIANDETFDAVTSPEITGYTADQAIVPEARGVRPALGREELEDLPEGQAPRTENIEITVTYKKNTDIPTPADETPAPPAEKVPVIPVEVSPIGGLENLTQVTTEPVVTIANPVSTVQTDRKVLPSTGESTGSTALLAGGITFLAGAALSLKARLKHKKSQSRYCTNK